jgi:hypothetical protein
VDPLTLHYGKQASIGFNAGESGKVIRCPRCQVREPIIHPGEGSGRFLYLGEAALPRPLRQGIRATEERRTLSGRRSHRSNAIGGLSAVPLIPRPHPCGGSHQLTGSLSVCRERSEKGESPLQNPQD